MFTRIQNIHFFAQRGRDFVWQGSDAHEQRYTLTGTSLGHEVTRVLLTRGAQASEARYPTSGETDGTLPYLSWMVDRGDESWPETAPHDYIENIASCFAASASGLCLICPAHAGEHFYGLGERTGKMDKQGQAFPIWNVDPPMGHDAQTPTMYVSIPFYTALNAETGQAHGVFLDHAGRVEVDLALEQPDQVTLTIEGDTLAAYFFVGPTPADVVRQYSELTGRMPLPPRWALGHHQSRWGYESAEQVREIARTLRERQHPCDTLWLDIDYMDGFRNFTWNPDTFAQPRQLVEELRQQGLRLVTIVDPGTKLDEDYAVYQQGHERDYFCRYPNGNYFLGEVWPGPCVFPDYSRQDVREWWGKLYADHLDLGVAGIWNDMNEPALTSILSENSSEHVHGRTMDSDVLHRPDVKSSSGQDTATLSHKLFHNAYGLQMARSTFEGLRRLRPDERPFVLSRAGTGGIQRYAAIWTGDNTSVWEHIPLAMTMCLNLSMSGVPFVGVDIGGFWNDSNGELLTRFAQLGAFTPFSRNHNAKFNSAQEPWVFGEPYESAYRTAIELRYRSLPYLYTLFAEAARNGAPIMRPLYYHYPQDARAFQCEDEFLIGEHLLSAPICQEGASSREVYLPEGAWFDFWSDQIYNGAQTHTLAAPLERWPLLVRANSILPLGPVMQHTGERATDPLTIHCYMSEQGQASFTLYEDDGTSLAHTHGVFAETLITCRADIVGAQVEIEERFSNYRPQREWYEIVVHLA
ncbi:MAG TPA: TIM-barrel domain-containing protein, partial [Ktedonobacteraceae bacterium]|nr:TIM-barrel domain-containing protein [Ktedonobacteraceae bacterium]